MSKRITAYATKIVRHGAGFFGGHQTTWVETEVVFPASDVAWAIEKNGHAVILSDEGELHLACTLDTLNEKLGDVIDVRE